MPLGTVAVACAVRVASPGTVLLSQIWAPFTTVAPSATIGVPSASLDIVVPALADTVAPAGSFVRTMYGPMKSPSSPVVPGGGRI